VNYRSVVVLARARAVSEPAEKALALEAIVDKVVRGRGARCRPPSDAELRGTSVLALPIDEASAKLRCGPPRDDEADLATPHWAGVVPLVTRAAAPIAAPDLAPGAPFPHDLARDFGGTSTRHRDPDAPLARSRRDE
jgi:uncharacterized protein